MKAILKFSAFHSGSKGILILLMNSIHLIQKDRKLAPRPEIPKESVSLWISGYWAVSESTAKQLVGGKIYFHKTQVAEAFRGGDIVGFEIISEGEHAGRILFRFRNDPEAKGARTPREGWSMEKKIVSD